MVYYDPGGHEGKQTECGGGNPNSQDKTEADRVADDGVVNLRLGQILIKICQMLPQ